MSFCSPKIKIIGVIFQNSFGARFYSKYFLKHSTIQFNKSEFDLQNEEGQRKFQSKVLQKIKRMNVISKLKPEQTEIFSLNNLTVLFKVLNELQIYLICEQDENYFVMENVIDCLGKVLQMVSKQKYEGKVIYDRLDSIVIATDEIIDEGIIANLDANIVFDRLKMRDASDPNKRPENNQPQQPSPGGGAFSSFFGFAKSSLQKTLNLG